MGGVFYRKSEIITPTEFNAFCDPEALTHRARQRHRRSLMVGLDVTMQVLVEAQQFEELATIDTPLGKLVNRLAAVLREAAPQLDGRRRRDARSAGSGAGDRPDAGPDRARPISASISPAPLPSARPSPITGTSAASRTTRRSPSRSIPTRFFKLMFDLLRD